MRRRRTSRQPWSGEWLHAMRVCRRTRASSFVSSRICWVPSRVLREYIGLCEGGAFCFLSRGVFLCVKKYAIDFRHNGKRQ